MGRKPSANVSIVIILVVEIEIPRRWDENHPLKFWICMDSNCRNRDTPKMGRKHAVESFID